MHSSAEVCMGMQRVQGGTEGARAQGCMGVQGAQRVQAEQGEHRGRVQGEEGVQTITKREHGHKGKGCTREHREAQGGRGCKGHAGGAVGTMKT